MNEIDLDYDSTEIEKEIVKERLALARTEEDKAFWTKQYDRLFDKSVEFEPKYDDINVSESPNMDDDHFEDFLRSDFFKGQNKNRRK